MSRENIDLVEWLGTSGVSEFESEKQIRAYFSVKNLHELYPESDLAGREEAMEKCLREWRQQRNESKVVEAKRDIAKELHEAIRESCTPIDREQRFRDMLDECYSFKGVGGPFEYLLPSRVLEEMDPTAFRCGVSDYEDSEDWVEIDDCYYARSDVEGAREDFIAELENEKSSAMDEENQDEIEEIDALIEAVKAVEF